MVSGLILPISPLALSIAKTIGKGADSIQMFLGTKNKVYVLDKSENNPLQINGTYGTHPAWAVEYDLASNDCESRFGYILIGDS